MLKPSKLSTMRRSGRLAGRQPTGSGSAPSAEPSKSSRSGRRASKKRATEAATGSGSSPCTEPSKYGTSSTPTADNEVSTKLAPTAVDEPEPEASTSSPTAEVTITVARAKLESLEKDSVSFRLLDALLMHAPTVEGLNIIISDIITASAETNGLDQLAKFYITGLFLPSNLHIFISVTSQVSMIYSEGWWSDTYGFISSFSRRSSG